MSKQVDKMIEIVKPIIKNAMKVAWRQGYLAGLDDTTKAALTGIINVTPNPYEGE